MRYLLPILGILAVIASFCYSFIQKRRLRKTAERLADMLDHAMAGEFKESDFTEEVDSFLESKLRDYLATSALSASRVNDEKDKIKSLISDISHQTKTPIANLMLYSELLEEEPEITPSAGEKIRAIKTQSEKLQFLIDVLVKMSRLENGILRFTPCIVSCDDLMDQVCNDLAAKATAKGLELNYEASGINVECDPKWTLEALSNIADNAIKYTDKGSIFISAKRYEIYSVISIKDTGRGISDDEKPKVFGRFYRGRDISSTSGEGVGIGLYLAREIITGEGGYIKLNSTLGKGSEFQIFLPSSNLSKLS